MKIISLTIGLLLIATLAFAEPVYREEAETTTTINRDKTISVKEVTVTYKDDVAVLERITDRQVYTPDLDYDRCTSDKVKSLYDGIEPIAEVVWTKETIKKFKAKKAERELIQ